MADSRKLYVDFILRGQEKIQQQLSSVEKVGTKTASKIDAAFSSAWKSMAAGYTVGNLLMRGFDSLTRGIGESINAAMTFNASMAALNAQVAQTNVTGDELVQTLQRSTSGMVSLNDLSLAANRSIALLGKESIPQLGKLADIATRASKVMGTTVTTAFDDLTLAIGRQSKMILDNLGIIMSVEDANERYAAQLRINVKDLTEADRKQAFLNEALRQGAEKYGNISVAVDDAATKTQAYKAAIENTKIELGNKLLPVQVEYQKSLKDVLDYLNKIMEAQDKMHDKNKKGESDINAITGAFTGLAGVLKGVLWFLDSIAKAGGVVGRGLGWVVEQYQVLPYNYDPNTLGGKPVKGYYPGTAPSDYMPGWMLGGYAGGKPPPRVIPTTPAEPSATELAAKYGLSKPGPKPTAAELAILKAAGYQMPDGGGGGSRVPTAPKLTYREQIGVQLQEAINKGMAADRFNALFPEAGYSGWMDVSGQARFGFINQPAKEHYPRGYFERLLGKGGMPIDISGFGVTRFEPKIPRGTWQGPDDFLSTAPGSYYDYMQRRGKPIGVPTTAGGQSYGSWADINEQQMMAAMIQGGASGGWGGLLGAGAGAVAANQVGGPWGQIIGAAVQMGVGLLFKKKQPTVAEPIPVKVVNWDGLTQLLNITKGNLVGSASRGTDRLNELRMRQVQVPA